MFHMNIHKHNKYNNLLDAVVNYDTKLCDMMFIFSDFRSCYSALNTIGNKSLFRRYYGYVLTDQMKPFSMQNSDWKSIRRVCYVCICGS